MIDRSKKSREVHAEQMLKASTTLATAFIATVLLVPMSAIMASWVSPDVGVAFLQVVKNFLFSWEVFPFVIFEVLLAITIHSMRERAYDIYDELYSDGIKSLTVDEGS